jgi:hypothetical protein
MAIDPEAPSPAPPTAAEHNGRDPGPGALRVRLALPLPGGTATVIEPGTDGTALVDGIEAAVRLEPQQPPRARLTAAGAVHDVLVLPGRTVAVPAGGGTAPDGIARLEVVVDGWRHLIELEPEHRARLRERATRANAERAGGGPLEVRAIIPGRVVSVDVASGDKVEAGQRMLVVEAMKMQNELRAPRRGTVGRVEVGPGGTIELGDLLLVLE